MTWDFPYDSPSAIIELLERRGFAASKKFGQNFLISAPIRQRIAASMEPLQDAKLWEIGPGLGALTRELLRGGAFVTAFEIDHGFCSILREEAFPEEERFRLIEGDALKTWPAVYEKEGTPDIICGNLPYNVGSICIARFLESQCLPAMMVFTLQKEVADRLGAHAGSKAWSTLSILAQVDYEVTQLFTIKGGAFFPAPQVESAVVRLTKRGHPQVPVSKRTVFLEVVSDLFTQRRKTVRNNLLQGKTGARHGKEGVLEALALASIAESERAEKLDFEQLLRLSQIFQEMGK
ncbi:MAG: 16S rRNA (adenine(1518)-N(6)/adenine(1519)-N(6))-dimethyltransferase RsmA [Sphaerochaetaceae bacterium]|jgi:16S rRNA (adenine1518-N6/adenine1519-N6)-dimethyltransferase|nr:16S rRNA (adenine(1518)-N(6)/adenine(1519)-N(6))-dimethyltransferase RsmA [Sphaerochaetaceae bacterium]